MYRWLIRILGLNGSNGFSHVRVRLRPAASAVLTVSRGDARVGIYAPTSEASHNPVTLDPDTRYDKRRIASPIASGSTGQSPRSPTELQLRKFWKSGNEKTQSKVTSVRTPRSVAGPLDPTDSPNPRDPRKPSEESACHEESA
jgi:hypothetical protein